MRVIIADDHTVVRQGIRGVLEEVDGLEVVAEAGDGEEALALVVELAPDVVVLDVTTSWSSLPTSSSWTSRCLARQVSRSHAS